MTSPVKQMCDTDAGDTSIESLNGTSTSTSTLASVLSVSVTSKKQKNAAKKQSLLAKRREKKRQKKVEKNKISKEDFYSKHTEFRTWLWEEKNMKFEELNASKSKDYFKKFVKKWNDKKLPKNYYRGIVSCWFDGSPATQSLWAMPQDVAVTPGSIHEETLDRKYSRAAADVKSLGTFGKRQGKQALRHLQTMFMDNLNDEAQEDKKNSCEDFVFINCAKGTTRSSSSLPEVSTTRELCPKPPRRTCSLRNMESKAQTVAIFQEDLSGKSFNSKRSFGKENFTISSSNKKRCSPSENYKSYRYVTPHKMQKQDSYISQIESASHSMFNNLELRSGKKLQSTVPRKARPVSADSSTLWKPVSERNLQRQFAETPKCATVRHSTHLSLFTNGSSFDTHL